MPDVAKKKRIFQIAKELNISHLEIMEFLSRNDISADSHMAPVSPDMYDEILLEFSKDKIQIERHRKEQARKVVVSKIQQIHPEETTATSKSLKSNVRKLQTSLKDKKLPLSDKLKDASSKLEKEKKNTAPVEEILEIKNILPKSDISDSVKISPEAQGEKKIEGTLKQTPKSSVKSEIAPNLRKLKKISVQDIADKINQTRKRTVKGNSGQTKPQIKQPLPQFGKVAGKKKVRKKDKILDPETPDSKKSIKVPEFTTVDELAQSMDVTAQQVIMACMGMGLMVTINQRMDMDGIIMVADEFGFDVESVNEFAEEKTSIEDLLQFLQY
jgi:translation initiation factor IF-2